LFSDFSIASHFEKKRFMIKLQFQNIPEKKIKSGGKKSSDCFIEMKK
jgi:hypothetical protein